VVFARSFDERFHRSLVHAGILPSWIANEGDEWTLVQGDEIEMPGLPEALEPGVPIVVRNLTRGTQITVSHALGERDVQQVLAGGILEHGSVNSRKNKRRRDDAPRPTAREPVTGGIEA